MVRRGGFRDVEDLGRDGAWKPARVGIEERLAKRDRGDRYLERRNNHLHPARAPDTSRRAQSVGLSILDARAWLWKHEGLKARRIQDEESQHEHEKETAHHLCV
jgi:hypothetical protein